MDYAPVLEEQAKQRGLSFTSLSHVRKLSQSDKIACCGGSVVRVVTESSSDSTVALQDGPNSICYCAIHGDVTSRYPDVLTPGALLLLTNVTALVLSSSVAPLLIVCIDNVAGLALPQDNQPPTGSPSARASTVAVPAASNQHGGVAHARAAPGQMEAAPPPAATATAEVPVASVQQPCTDGPLARPHEATGISSEDEDGLELADDL